MHCFRFLIEVYNPNEQFFVAITLIVWDVFIFYINAIES